MSESRITDPASRIPDPPIHEKGLISFAGVKKPAWSVVQQIYKATAQIGPSAR